MDSAYDVPQIRDLSRQLGHVPLIDVNPRRKLALKEELTAENKRCCLAGLSNGVENFPLKSVE